MMKTLLLAGTALAFGTSGLLAASHPVRSSHKEAHRVISAGPPGSITLYDQNNDDSHVGVVSQNFTSGTFAAYNSQGADDFTIPKGHKWAIKEVQVTGVYFTGSGPATSENVLFYADNNGLPAETPEAECDNIPGRDNGAGSFRIPLPSTCKIKLAKGTHWISVVVNMVFSPAGEWGWELTTDTHGNPSAWRNPGGGFGDCPDWDTTLNCDGNSGDYMFTLKGKDLVKG